MSRKRLLGCLGAAAAVAFALSGCSLVSTAIGQVAGASAPKVGQCWNTTNANAANWADWQGSAALDCSRPHDLYTFAIGTISGVSAKSWASANDPEQPSATVEAKSAAACKLTQLLPKLKWNQELVQGYFFVPTESEWASGARWVRCDVGVLAFGTTLNAEALATLPTRISTLVSGVASDPKRYDFCVNTPSPGTAIGPLDIPDLNRVADCRTDPEWALVGRGNLAEAVGAPFPVGDAASADTQRVCAKFATNPSETWVGYLPQETSTATVGTDREIDCWVGQSGTASSGGVA